MARGLATLSLVWRIGDASRTVLILEYHHATAIAHNPNALQNIYIL